MNDLRERFAPLREETPTDEEIAAVLATRVGRRRRRPRRLLLGVATATATAAVAIAALPGADERPAEPTSAAGMLRAAAAVAADQPGPPAFTGYRYTEILERLRYHGVPGGPRASERRVENWVDRSWNGRSLTHRGRALEGRPDGFMIEADDRPYAYGDGPLRDIDISALPTEPRPLLQALEANFLRDFDPGYEPSDPIVDYHVARSVLLLLSTANTTPSLRAALWGVLALMPGLRAAPDVRDPLGREGEAVTLPGEALPVPLGEPPEHAGLITVIFDPQRSELLSWSIVGHGGGSPDMSLTFLRVAHVRQIGDRPR